jgi:hypothetical protein
MGKLNLAQIKAAQVNVASSNSSGDNVPSSMDSQISISQDSKVIPSKKAKKPEKRADGSEVHRSKDAQIIIRASPRMRRELKRWAVDEDATVQSLIVAGLQALRRERGLPILAE